MKMKNYPAEAKPNKFLRNLVEDVIASKSPIKGAQLPENFVSTLEVNPSLLKDVSVFNTLLGLDKVEILLAKTGIKMNQELSNFMKNTNFMGEKEAMNYINFPSFHLTLEKNYEEDFWITGDWLMSLIISP